MTGYSLSWGSGRNPQPHSSAIPWSVILRVCERIQFFSPVVICTTSGLVSCIGFGARPTGAAGSSADKLAAGVGRELQRSSCCLRAVEVFLSPRRSEPPHRESSEDVIGECRPQSDRQHFGGATHQQATKPAPGPEVSMDGFGGGGPFLVDLFAFGRGHALAVCSNYCRVAPLRRTRVNVVGLVLAWWCKHFYRAFGGVLDRGEIHVATVDQDLARQTLCAFFDLLKHRLEPMAVSAIITSLHTNDYAALGIGRELQVVGGIVAAIGHLHPPGLGIGGRNSRLGRPLRVIFGFGLRCLDQFELPERLFDARLALTRGTLPGGFHPGAAIRISPLRLGLERFDSELGLDQALLKRRLAAKRRRAGTGSDPHAVLRHPLEADQASVHQHCQDLGEEIIQSLTVLAAEVTDHVVIDRDATANPAVGVVGLTQTVDFARAADVL